MKKPSSKTVKKILIGVFTPILIALLVAGLGALWYFFIRETPKKIFRFAVRDARSRDINAFKSHFAPDSVRILEMSWSGENYGRSGSWATMMESVLENNGAPPEVVEETVANSGDQARVQIRLDDQKRNIYFVRIERTPKILGFIPRGSDWKIDVLNGINASINEEARKVTAQKETPAKRKFTKEPRERGWWKPEEKKDKKQPEQATEEEPDANKARKGPEPGAEPEEGAE